MLLGSREARRLRSGCWFFDTELVALLEPGRGEGRDHIYIAQNSPGTQSMNEPGDDVLELV